MGDNRGEVGAGWDKKTVTTLFTECGRVEQENCVYTVYRVLCVQRRTGRRNLADWRISLSTG